MVKALINDKKILMTYGRRIYGAANRTFFSSRTTNINSKMKGW